MPKISVLRLSHRIPRDERTTTHVALVARAFGADEIIYTGQRDSGLEKSINELVTLWGGEFSISYEKSFRKVISEYKKKGYSIVHMTMYGVDVDSTKISEDKILVIVGSEKVPAEVFELADYNVAVKNQPHSEIAALAILLDRLDVKRTFDGKLKIIPSSRGKKILKKE